MAERLSGENSVNATKYVREAGHQSCETKGQLLESMKEMNRKIQAAFAEGRK